MFARVRHHLIKRHGRADSQLAVNGAERAEDTIDRVDALDDREHARCRLSTRTMPNLFIKRTPFRGAMFCQEVASQPTDCTIDDPLIAIVPRLIVQTGDLGAATLD
jgi:hypothetical protein